MNLKGSLLDVDWEVPLLNKNLVVPKCHKVYHIPRKSI